MALVLYQGPSENPFGSASGIAESKEGSSFVGLSNQGATCYLNGLLQTLFMTPEFRKSIFTWNYNPEKDGAEEFCIPLQLQRLFGLLQLSNERAVDTVALTHSFGWEGSEVFQQQDVQELTRVLFDALEETFKGTAVENIIDDLYAGQLIDYLRCLDVDYQSERVDKFLDFSLAIVPFGSDKPMHSLTECIEMYLRPEILDGDNKYYAEKYDQKVDAIKGLKFGKLPQIMSVQLKRFVYDFSGYSVVQKKLNDVVKFPMILDMNKYVAGAAASDASTSTNGHENVNNEFEEFLVKQIDLLKAGRGASSNGEAPPAFAASDADLESGGNPFDGDSQKAPTSPEKTAEAPIVYESMTRAEVAELVAQRGEWIYELYAVLIHSGVINGGHYYAYIKDLSSQRWWNFNDSTVSSIDEKVVREAWGGAHSAASHYPGLYGARSQSSANAYMLMYRKVSKGPHSAQDTPSTEDLLSDPPLVTDEMVPLYIRQLVEAERKKEEERKRALEEERRKLKVKVFFNSKDSVLHTTRTATYKEFLALLWDNLDVKAALGDTLTQYLSQQASSTAEGAPATEPVDPDAPCFDLIRLRNYNSYTQVKSDTYDVETSADKTLDALNFNDYRTYLLETRSGAEPWEEYFADGTSLVVIEFDPLTGTFKDGRSLRVRREATVGDVRQQVARWVAYPIERLRLMKIVNCGFNDAQLDILVKDEASLQGDVRVYEGFKLYVEEAPEDDTAPCQAYEAYVRSRNVVEIRVNRPPDASFEVTLKIDLRWTVNKLREVVAKELGLEGQEIRLFKQSLRGQELRDGSLSLSSNAIYNNLGIAVSVGKATPAGYYNVLLTEFTALPGTTVEVVELPDGETDFEVVDLGNGEKVVLMADADDDDGPPPLISVSSTSPRPIAMYEDYDAGIDPALYQDAEGSVASNEGVADWSEAREFNDLPDNVAIGDIDVDVEVGDFPDFDSQGDAVPPLVAQVEAVAAFAQPALGGEQYATASADDFLPTVNSTSDLGGVQVQVAEAVPMDGVDEEDGLYEEQGAAAARKALSILSSAAAAAAATAAAGPTSIAPGEDLSKVTPSDFGEQTVRNVNLPTQFENVDGLSGLFVQGTTTYAEVKAQIAKKLVELGRLPEGASPNRIRLRDKLGTSPGKILAGTGSFADNQVYLYDHKVLAFQVLEREEMLPELENGSVVVLAQRWHRSTWSLGERVEVLLRGSMSIRNIARGLANLMDIPLDSLQAMVLPKEAEFLLSDMHLKSPPQNYGRAWFDPSKEHRVLRVMSHEMRVQDGDVLLLQDTAEPLMILSAADRKSVELVRVASQASGGYMDFWSASQSSPANYGASSSFNKNPFDSSNPVSGTGSGKALKRGHSSANGVHIKTHRDRLQEQSDRSLNSTAAVAGADGASTPASTASGRVSPLPGLEPVGGAEARYQDETDYRNNNMDEREFNKQGGMALFEDIN